MANAQNVPTLKVFIDPTVLELVDNSKPPYFSRTGWVNHLIQVGVAQERQRAAQLDD